MSRTVLYVAALTVIASVFGASAFTTGYADRTASITVATDTDALVGLADGNSGDLVSVTGDQLTIDFSNTGVAGPNEDATFILGDNSSGNVTYAFTITNNDAAAHTLKLQYTSNSPDGDSTDNVEFNVYDSANTQLVRATDENGEQASSADAVASGETVTVVIVVDTTSKATGADMGGTLRVTLA